MGLYSNLRGTATRLLKAYGRFMTVVNEAGVARSVFAMRNKTIVHTYPESGVQVGDIEFLMEAAANPVLMERLETGDASLVIIATDPIKPADTVLAWYVYGRAG